MIDAGKSLGSFRLVEKLDRGQRRHVWRALDTASGTDRVLRIIPGGFADKPENMTGLEQDIRRVGELKHPGIVPIDSIEQAGEVAFLVMPLVVGKSLRKEIPAGGMPPELFARRAGALTEIVAVAHRAGVPHRGLNPANVYIGADDRLQVIGFGCGALRDGSLDPNLEASDAPTQTLPQERMERGTISYLAPEQLQGRERGDLRSDVFALGAILHEMATGARAFDGESAADVIVAILRDEPQPVTELNGALPPALDRIIRLSLDKDAARRLPAAQDVVDELARI